MNGEFKPLLNKGIYVHSKGLMYSEEDVLESIKEFLKRKEYWVKRFDNSQLIELVEDAIKEIFGEAQ